MQFIDPSLDFYGAVETLAGPRPNGAAKATTEPKKVVAERYNYCDASGELVYQVERASVRNHSASVARPGKANGRTGVEALPYRLPELADASGIVLVVEGERKVDALRALGFHATCNSGGAGKWTDKHSTFLGRLDVVIVPDNDGPGRKHGDAVGASL